jgi:hypothetical protein
MELFKGVLTEEELMELEADRSLMELMDIIREYDDAVRRLLNTAKTLMQMYSDLKAGKEVSETDGR